MPYRTFLRSSLRRAEDMMWQLVHWTNTWFVKAAFEFGEGQGTTRSCQNGRGRISLSGSCVVCRLAETLGAEEGMGYNEDSSDSQPLKKDVGAMVRPPHLPTPARKRPAAAIRVSRGGGS
jgi:hypothetical protein